jgi:tetratricopeptide (TPR) repeat protein
MSSRGFVTLACVLAFACLAWFASTSAHADAASDRKARAHAKAARAYFDTGDFAHAILEYQAAYDLDHKPSRLYNLAVCHERSGDAEGALAFYRQYLEADPDGEAARPAAESIAAIERDLAAAADAAAEKLRRAAAQRAADEERTRQEEAAKAPPEAAPAPGVHGKNGPTANLPTKVAPAPSVLPPAPLPTTFPGETTKPRHRTWLWAAAAGVAIATGLVIDSAPASAQNGTLDGTDFVPLGFYALGVTLGAIYVF